MLRVRPPAVSAKKKQKFRIHKLSFVLPFALLLLWLYFVLVSITTTTRNRNTHHNHVTSSSLSTAHEDPMAGSSSSMFHMRVVGRGPSDNQHESPPFGGSTMSIVKAPDEKKKDVLMKLVTTTSTPPRYWRYDDARPQIHSARTLQLPSVPRHHRLGREAISNITEYSRHAENVYPQRDYYFDYNPSIVRLPSIANAHANAHAGPYYYLASFRVSNQNYCFHPQDRQRIMTGSSANSRTTNNNSNNNNNKDWLGLALLSAQLDILADGVVNVQEIPGLGGRSAQDFRLFVLPAATATTSNNNNNKDQSSSSSQQIYLSSNDVIVPLWVALPSPSSKSTPFALPTNVHATRIPHVFGTLEAWIRPFVSCAPCHRGGGKQQRMAMCGKNFNYFAPAAGNAIHSENAVENDNGTAFCEIWPSPPHLVRAINLTQPCQRQFQQELEQPHDSNNNNDYAVEWSSSTSIVHSFATIEQAWFPDAPPAAAANANNSGRRQQQNNKFLTRGRGSACCIEIVINDTHEVIRRRRRRLWMGIEHSKTLPSRISSSRGGSSGTFVQQPNHYLSRLYAFEQEAPFALVARSGHFCLGFPSPSEHQQQHDEDNPPLVQVTSWRKLVLGNPNQTTTTTTNTNISADDSASSVVFDCPRIHFVSGMTLDATNSSLVIIAYGVNDCLSRFVRVHLEDLQQLLFTGPSSLART
jgi:hypothetical protein